LERGVERRWEHLRPTLVQRAVTMIGARSFGAGAPLAEDLAQLALLRLSQAPAAGALSGDELRRYALTTLHHAFLDECTRRHRELLPGATLPDVADDDHRSPERALGDEQERKATQTRLTAALATLSDVERAFLRASLDAGSAPEAQRRCGWPPGGASSACQARNRIVERLRRALLVTEAP
jgi:DNA-directed RNA polymerase specialized sigma24 family protein